MLWKKESRQSDALYIDIFTPNTQYWDSFLNLKLQSIDQKPHPKKSDAIALEKRNEGNRLFRNSKTIEALGLYGDSLRFAHPGSEHISLAYANRSACFLSLKMYNKCLADIECAKAAGYPEHLRSKLDDRKAKCLKEMQEDSQHPCEKFSIESDEKFPCLSNMVEIQRNGDKDDYSVVAKKDIDVGQLVAIEDTYHAIVTHCFGLYCNNCAKELCNLVPCEKCAVAMFCPECQGHALHEHECGLNFCGESEYNSDVMRLVRDILLVLNLFPTVDELMVFVEQMLKQPNQLPDNMLDNRTKYQAFFNNPFKQNIDSIDQMGPLIYPVYKTLLRIPHVNGMIKTMRHRRFLMHLIGHHVKIPYQIAGLPSSYPICYSQVMGSYFKHSCISNTEFVRSSGKCQWYSVKPIRKGEQLFISHALPDMKTTAERKKYLLKNLNMRCECSRCQGKVARPEQLQQLVSDPAFHFIKESNTKDSERLMGACETVLQQYGRMDWCDEMNDVRECFSDLYEIKAMEGGLNFKHPLARKLLQHLKN